MDEIIHFTAEIIKVQTMEVVKSIRLTFDIPETDTETMAKLAECKARGGYLQIAAIPIEKVVNLNSDKQKRNRNNGEISEGTKRESSWATTEGSNPDELPGESGEGQGISPGAGTNSVGSPG